MEIAVEDSGVGMTQQQVSRLFTPFTKIKSNRELNKEGVGLGLAVSKNIANALGGDITVTSESGRGSIFTLTLPIEWEPRIIEDPSAKENSSKNSFES